MTQLKRISVLALISVVFLIIAIVVLFWLRRFYKQPTVSSEQFTNQLVNEEGSSNEVTQENTTQKFDPSLIDQVEPTSDEIFSDIHIQLIEGNSIEPLENIPSFSVPDYLHPRQLGSMDGEHTNFHPYYKINDVYFALYRRSNMSFYIAEPGGIVTTHLSGIAYAKAGDTTWQPWRQIHSDQSRNNPLAMWNEDDNLYVLISDDTGAGSGEGIAKIFLSENGGKDWEVNTCFYYRPELLQNMPTDIQLSVEYFDNIEKISLTDERCQAVAL